MKIPDIVLIRIHTLENSHTDFAKKGDKCQNS